MSAVIAVLSSCALLPSTAAAGTYTVHACKTPLEGGGDVDWERATRHGGWAPRYYAADDCPDGSFSFGLDPAVTHTADDYIRYRFKAPADTEIQGYSIWRSVRLAPSYSMYLSAQDASGDQVGDYAETCVNACDSRGDPADPLSAANLVTASGLSGVGRIQVDLTCGMTAPSTSRCAAGSVGASYQLHRADVTLRDDSPPQLEAAPEGPLLDGRPLIGTQQVWISASDRGSGVHEVLFEIDGKVVDRAIVDDNGGACRPPFRRARPCKLEVAGPVSFDTSRVPDGLHRLRLLVTDATGTSVAPWGTFQIKTSNSTCNPRPTVQDRRVRLRFAGKGASKQVRTTRYGNGPRVEGRLTTATGDPLPNARLCVAASNPGTRFSFQHLMTVTTNVSGHFAFRMPRGPSRRVYAVSRTSHGAAAASVRVRVRASASLRASRKRLRNRDRLVLRGRLRGGPVPRGGVLIELQARRGSRWQTFGTTNSGRKGKFHFGYRFTRTVGVQRYQLRARVPRQGGYPYAAGASRPVTVTVAG